MQLPETSELRPLIRDYAKVLGALELEPTEQPLVLPTNHWFPDRFQGDEPSFEHLVARMQGYAGLEGVELEARLLGASDNSGRQTQACGTGGCATPKAPLEGPRLLRSEAGWLLEVPAAAVNQPIALTAHVARALGQVRLVEAGHANEDTGIAELAATALGFGVLLLEASHLYSKGCGGPNVGRATLLSCGQLAVPFSLFVAFEKHSLRSALAELATTQRAVVDEAWALVQSNPRLVEALRDDPERVARGDFKLGAARSWLARWFGVGGRPRPQADPEQAALRALERGDDVGDIAALLASSKGPERPTSSTKGRDENDDVSQLVDEALAELRQAKSAKDNRTSPAE